MSHSVVEDQTYGEIILTDYLGYIFAHFVTIFSPGYLWFLFACYLLKWQNLVDISKELIKNCFLFACLVNQTVK